MDKLDQKIVDEIIDMYKNGSTPTEIGKKFNMFDTSVLRVLRKNGVPRDKSKAIPISKTVIDQVIIDYTAGESSEKIAEKFNINPASVCRILKKNNVPLRGRNNRFVKKEEI